MKTETKATHTPGPWEARQHTHRTDGSHTSTIVYQKDQYSPVSIVACHVEQNNAAMIAAAPELLETLKRIEIEAACIKSTGGMRIEQMAKQAIAKAEGR